MPPAERTQLKSSDDDLRNQECSSPLLLPRDERTKWHHHLGSSAVARGTQRSPRTKPRPPAALAAAAARWESSPAAP
eukprot:CAMPEP_0184403672 /NCGR_PEP_ID=MMETSP0007-20130409/85542_1 /TAXON_ID=97485 /ORGANISM="Prymnesium parvum, Strain Texoma1" /LENGTH=76 /DNA_ID=CAMNT_0026759795 /DNA_START=504 /DNA_END=732 /DNA_ORIENTATION=-